MTQQQQVIVSWVLTTLAAAALGRGLISQDMANWIASPETLAFLGAVGGFATLAWRWWATRPKAVVASAANLPQVQAVIATPAVAESTATPGNVVTSASAAAALPGVPK